MSVLTGRERQVFTALAGVLIDEPSPPCDRMMAYADRHLARATRFMRLFFRVSLLAFEWGTYFLVTGDGRFEHFSRMPARAQRRYARLWMHHRSALMRQVFAFLKVMVVSPYYDNPEEAARVGFAPKWAGGGKASEGALC